ncbi:MAG: hypothetical protein GY943_36120 [Chloroflexi bacterium]|nr:hypothetical protein [Chloroflexota bacterium]
MTTVDNRKLSQAEKNLIRRVASLAKRGDGVHDLRLVIVKRDVWVAVNGQKLEKLGRQV